MTRYQDRGGNLSSSPSSGVTRREMLKGAGTAVTLGALAAAFGVTLPAGARAAESAAGVNCMTILYPTGAGSKFDADYHRDHHLPLFMKHFGKSVERIELRKVVPAPAGAPAAAYAAAVNIWFDDLDVFNANNAKYGQSLIDDIPNFTNVQPEIQYDKVYGMVGAPRSAMILGDTCVTILYPSEPNGRWDVEKYRTSHMPLIMKLYGPKAIKRFELRKGESGQTGGAPKYIGTVNIYIADQNEFDAAAKQHTETLRKDVPSFSSVMPTALQTTIHGLGMPPVAA